MFRSIAVIFTDNTRMVAFSSGCATVNDSNLIGIYVYRLCWRWIFWRFKHIRLYGSWSKYRLLLPPFFQKRLQNTFYIHETLDRQAEKFAVKINVEKWMNEIRRRLAVKSIGVGSKIWITANWTNWVESVACNEWSWLSIRSPHLNIVFTNLVFHIRSECDLAAKDTGYTNCTQTSSNQMPKNI